MHVANPLLLLFFSTAAPQQDAFRSADQTTLSPNDGTAARAQPPTARDRKGDQADDGATVDPPPLNRRILSRLENRLDTRITSDKLTRARDALLGDGSRDRQAGVDQTRYRDDTDPIPQDMTRSIGNDEFATEPPLM